MLKIGVTGGIGSGKTFICSLFARLEIPIYNADTEAKKLLNNNSYVKKELINTFGSNIYDKNQQLIKHELAAIIFNQPEALEKVNSIVHPAVNEHFDQWVESKKQNNYVIKEAAILFESGSYKGLDVIVSVVAPQALRIKRVIGRDNISKEAVLSRIKNQWTDSERIKRSDFVIYNDGSTMLLPQIIEVYQSIQAKNTKEKF